MDIVVNPEQGKEVLLRPALRAFRLSESGSTEPVPRTLQERARISRCSDCRRLRSRSLVSLSDSSVLQLADHPAKLGEQVGGDRIFGRSHRRRAAGYRARPFQPGEHCSRASGGNLLGDGERRESLLRVSQ